MKRLKDHKGLFAGKETTITLTELRGNPGDVFAQVELGMKFIITKNGKVVATINPIEPNALELGASARRLGPTKLKAGNLPFTRQEADLILSPGSGLLWFCGFIVG